MAPTFGPSLSGNALASGLRTLIVADIPAASADPLTKYRARNKCPVPYARDSPFGCFAQKVPDTYFSAAPKLVPCWSDPLEGT
jgi:hypothetical protein